MSEADGFLSRWARRKARVQSGVAERTEVALPERADAPSIALLSPATGTPLAHGFSPAEASQAAPVEASRSAPADAVPLPTMADVAQLTRASDYSRFVAPGVEPGVRNAAMKKLFSDPHFNVMDGLDTYIDDYSKPDPIPMAMLRQMNQSKFLGLFDDEVGKDATGAAISPDGAVPMPVAQSSPIDPSPAPPVAASDLPPDDDPDLRLQQDDGIERPGPAPGPRA